MSMAEALGATMGQYVATTEHPLGRLLLLDDEVMLLEVLQEMLERMGFDVAVATSVEDALALLNDAAQPFRVAILDLNIPGGPGGLELVQPLRYFAPQVFLIATSGAPTEPPMQEPLSFGFGASLEKPYRLNELQQLLAMYGLI